MLKLVLLLVVVSCLNCVTAKAAAGSNPQSKMPSVSILIPEVDQVSMTVARIQVEELIKQGEKTLLFKINSFGGSVWAGLEFIDYVEELKKTLKITTICVADQKVMSMGFVILESPMCDVRLATNRTVFLAHKAAMGTSGNSNTLQESTDYLVALDHAVSNMIGARIKMGVKAYEEKISKQAWIFTYEEALKELTIDGKMEVSEIPPVMIFNLSDY